jgi:hypothetical protein
MDLREGERISKSHKWVLPKVDLSGWEITCTKFPSHAKKQSNNAGMTTHDHSARLCYNCK